ncbi:hypothetical protein WMY93_032908 [Mugilogobius chulae]|uniref:ATP-dependent RNA helicase n=1 Tax=Mugilogobius chulae TaxID=88201 RepID=A0AAW0MMN8_9GOBI
MEKKGSKSLGKKPKPARMKDGTDPVKNFEKWKKKYNKTKARVKSERRREKKPEWQVEKEQIDRLVSRYADINPKDAVKFSDFPLSKKTLLGLQEAQYRQPTEIQRQTIGFALRGKDVLGAAKTGSGKTLAFLIPMLECLYRHQWSSMDGLGALIISPTRELAYQTFEVLRKVGKNHEFSAGLVIGGKDLKTESERIHQTNIVICTPGRLLQHMDQTACFTASDLLMLVLDEADRILDLGFSDTLNAIVENLPPSRQTLLFSATQTRSVKDLARLSLRDPEYVWVHEKARFSTPATLEQNYTVCELQHKVNLLFSFIRSHLKKKVIVFFACCKEVQYLFRASAASDAGGSRPCFHAEESEGYRRAWSEGDRKLRRDEFGVRDAGAIGRTLLTPRTKRAARIECKLSEVVLEDAETRNIQIRAGDGENGRSRRRDGENSKEVGSRRAEHLLQSRSEKEQWSNAIQLLQGQEKVGERGAPSTTITMSEASEIKNTLKRTETSSCADLGKLQFSAGLVIGGKDLKTESERIHQTNIVICTPGRLLQHMDQTACFTASDLLMLVLDEADRILDLGFSDTLNAIVENLPPSRQTLLFSATQTRSVKPGPAQSEGPGARFSTPATLEQNYTVCELQHKVNLLFSFIRSHLKKKVIVFFACCKEVQYLFRALLRVDLEGSFESVLPPQTRRSSDSKVFCRLRPGVPLTLKCVCVLFQSVLRLRPGVPVLALHGKQQQMKRVEVYNDFVRKQNAVLFATDIAARGLDFPAVNWVLQFDCPEDADTYIHRVGRTARYKEGGEALLLLLPSEEKNMVQLLQDKKVPINTSRSELRVCDFSKL